MFIIQHLTKVLFFKINTQKIHVATSTLQNLHLFRHFFSKKHLPICKYKKKAVILHAKLTNQKTNYSYENNYQTMFHGVDSYAVSQLR